MSNSLITRRSALVATLSTALIADASAQTGGEAVDPALEQHRHDFAFLVGRWNVSHHRLKSRLTNCTEWDDFRGTSELWLTLNGFGTIDDNWLDLPAGAYRAMGMRAFNPETRQWSIWWLDERAQTIDPPVRGSFRGNVGEFVGDDTLRGHPIRVRFRWTEIDTPTPKWEQAFSPDGGATWEVNWRMEFSRA